MTPGFTPRPRIARAVPGRRDAHSGGGAVALPVPPEDGRTGADRRGRLRRVAEYESDVIRKHEKTRADKEDDRTRHIEELRANDEPVFLTYRGRPDIDGLATRTATLRSTTSPPPTASHTGLAGARSRRPRSVPPGADATWPTAITAGALRAGRELRNAPAKLPATASTTGSSPWSSPTSRSGSSPTTAWSAIWRQPRAILERARAAATWAA